MTEKETPETLKPYLFHGLKLEETSGEEMVGDCPFCGSTKKFNVNVETSKFRCWSGGCAEQGNSSIFLKKFWALCVDATRKTDLRELADDSGFMGIEGLKAFGACLSVTNNKWLVPGFNAELSLTGLYKWTKLQDKQKKWVQKLLPTPGFGHHLFNLHNFDASKPIIDLCEGWRDGIAWYETLEASDDDAFSLVDRNVISVAGTNSFKTIWSKLFSDKIVNILFDNDYPKKNKLTGTIQEPAGLAGVKYVASILMAQENPPTEINFIDWGGQSKGYDEGFADGFDLRDTLRMTEN